MVSQSTAAYQQVKDMIFKMELLPGTRIPELQIAEKLGVSRTPVHDALMRLASDGLVTVLPNRGAVVHQFTEEEIREIGTIRLSQDILSADLAAYFGSASDFDDLARLAEACHTSAQKGDVYGRITADNAFHLAISAISGNARLHRQQQATYQQIHLIQVSKYTDIADSLQQIHHHGPIVEALRKGDLNELHTLICQHVKDFYHIDAYVLRCYQR